MRFLVSSFLILGLLIGTSVFAKTADVALDKYSIALEIFKNTIRIAAPTLVIKTNKEAEVSLTTDVETSSYKLAISPKATDKNGRIEIQAKLYEHQQDDWELIASPTFLATPGKVLTYSFGAPADMNPYYQIKLTINPFTSFDKIKTNVASSSPVTPNIMQKCAPCSDGSTICCSGGCCKDDAHGCGWVCDD